MEKIGKLLPLPAARVEHHSPPAFSRRVLSKAFLSTGDVGQLRTDTILTTKGGDSLLKGSNEGWADSVKERSETKSSQSHRLTDHPILEASVRPPLHWHGEDAVPGGRGGALRDG